MSSDKKRKYLNFAFPAIIFLLALTVRLIVAYQMSESNPTFFKPVIDSLSYDSIARNLAANGTFDQHRAFFQPPLYSLFLASIYKIFGFSYFTPRVLQAILGAMTCLLFYFIGKKVSGRGIGVIAGIIGAFYGPLIYFELELLPTGLTLFLSCLALLLIMRGLEKPAFHLFFFSGLCTGLAAIAWPLAGIFAGPGIISILLKFKNKLTHSFILLAALFLGIITAVGPVTTFNYLKGEPAIVSSNGGLNLYAGNNLNWKKTTLFRPGYDWEKLTTLPYKVRGPEVVKEIGHNSIYISETTNYIQNHPLDFFKALLSKFYFLIYGHEIMNPTDLNFFKRFSPLLDSLIFNNKLIKFPFGILFPLACVGIFIGLKKSINHNALLIQYLVFGAIGLLAFFISSRYRLIIVPTMLIYASIALHEIKAGFAGYYSRKSLIKAIFVGATLLVLSNLNIFNQTNYFNSPVFISQSYFFMGDALARQGKKQEALSWFLKAVSSDPNYSDAWIEIGLLEYEAGDNNGAISAWTKASEVAPDYPLPLYNLARLYDKARKYDSTAHEKAIYFYKRYLKKSEISFEKYTGRKNLVAFAESRLKALNY